MLSQADTARQTKRNVVLANPHRGHVIKAFGTGDDCDREAAIYRELLSRGVPGLVAFARPSTRRRHVIRMQYAKGPGAIGKIPERLMSGHVFARLITEVFTTLRTAHDTCGFCHNDLHRDNIMVTGTGSAADPFRAVLVDFDRASTTQTPQRAGVPQGSHNEDLARLMRIGHAILKHVRVSPHIRTAFLRLKRRVEHMRSVDVSTEPFFQIAREPPECHAIDCT